MICIDVRHYKSAFKLAASLLATTLVSGCSWPNLVSPVFMSPQGVPEVNVSSAPSPSVLQPNQVVEPVLSCIASTHALDKTIFMVGAFADSTGKINASAAGATGNFLPQGGSAAFITDALRRAGGQVVSTYFGPPSVKVRAKYAINGIFNSLDFGNNANIDFRAAGIGPTVATGWAELSLTVQLDDARTRLNQQIAQIVRPVRFQQFGFGIGHAFGSTLITGGATFSSQERLQLESLNGPIALGVADVIMKQFPDTRMCGGPIRNLLRQPYTMGTMQPSYSVPSSKQARYSYRPQYR